MAAIEYLEAWTETFTKKTKEPLASMLDDAFTFQSPSGLVGSEESDLGFPLHPECAIQTDANWYFLHGIFG